MSRMTYKQFGPGGGFCWEIKGADNELCSDVCRKQDGAGCKECPIAKAFDKLAAYEDICEEPDGLRAMLDSLKKEEA